jgi:hypothetical protein
MLLYNRRETHMDAIDTKILQAFTRFRKIKEDLRHQGKVTSSELEAARDDFCKLLPLAKNSERVLKEWEKAFHEAECKFHHQGG